MLQIYHLVPFFILWNIQDALLKFELPKVSENYILGYYSLALIAVLFFASKISSHIPFEELVIIMSYVSLQKLIVNSIEITNQNTDKDRDLLHPLVIATLLLSLKYNVLEYTYVKQGYLAILLFSAMSIITQQKKVDLIILDYFVVHCLFYFLKN